MQLVIEDKKVGCLLVKLHLHLDLSASRNYMSI